MKPSTPSTLRSRTATEDGKTERPPSTRLRKVVFRGAVFIVACAAMSTGCALLPSVNAALNDLLRDPPTGNSQPAAAAPYNGGGGYITSGNGGTITSGNGGAITHYDGGKPDAVTKTGGGGATTLSSAKQASTSTASPQGLTDRDRAWVNALPPNLQQQVLSLKPEQVDNLKVLGHWDAYRKSVTETAVYQGEAEAIRVYTEDPTVLNIEKGLKVVTGAVFGTAVAEAAQAPGQSERSPVTKWVTGDTQGLNSELLGKLAQVGEKIGKPVFIRSGFRTYDEQKVLYDKWLAGEGNLAAPPGKSDHESGKAADAYVGGMALRDDPAGKAAALSLGLAFPVQKESWHTELAASAKQISTSLASPQGLTDRDRVWVNALPPNLQQQVLSLKPEQVDSLKARGKWDAYRQSVTETAVYQGEAEAIRVYTEDPTVLKIEKGLKGISP